MGLSHSFSLLSNTTITTIAFCPKQVGVGTNTKLIFYYLQCSPANRLEIIVSIGKGAFE
jgi:hypothetical protein